MVLRLLARTFLQSNVLRPPTISIRSLSSQSPIKDVLPKGPLQDTRQRFREFQLTDKVFVVTGGGRGLGLAMAEALVEAGGEGKVLNIIQMGTPMNNVITVHCLDRLSDPEEEFHAAQARANPDFGGSLHYERMDVRNWAEMEDIISRIAERKNRLDGLIAAAGVNYVASAIHHSPADIDRVVSTNYTGLFATATIAAKQMFKTQSHGSILLIGSISGLVANKGMTSAIYNSSKAAVIQLARSLAMEWGKDGIRVNSLCPGHVVTSMAQMAMDQAPDTRNIWESENMLGRLGRPEEFRGITLLLMSDASSFMTGSTVVVDGGHTAW